MDYFRRLEPTPSALRNGRLTFAILAVVVGVSWALLVLVPGYADTGTLLISAATTVTLSGTAIAYLGSPTLTRYRLGLIVMAIGMVTALWLLIANPFPAPAS